MSIGHEPEKDLEKISTDEDNRVKVQWTFRRIIAIASLCAAYVGAQTILYFVGGELTYIATDIDTQFQDWLGTANTLAVAAICPFVGYLTDIVGRRWITIGGTLFLVVACVLVGTMHTLGQGIAGMALGGIGAGICELNAIAGVAEITPVRYRGVTIAIVTFSIIFFIPYEIYIQALYLHATWRWTMCIAGVWNLLALIGIVFSYKPPPRTHGMTAAQIAWQIDYVGGFLSIAGVTLFLVGLQSGGYQFPWPSVQTLAPLLIGVVLMVAFAGWEAFGAKHPMVPAALFNGQRIVGLSYVIVAIAGVNFYSLLNFYPLTLQFFYPPDPLVLAKRAIGYPLAILVGACAVNYAISYTKGHIRPLFLICAVLMTAFSGALAAATPVNPALALAFSTLAAFGVGGIIVPALTIALYACPDHLIGTATALSLSVRFLGGSIGNTIYFNVFNNKITSLLPTLVGQYAVEAGLPAASVQSFVVAFVATGEPDPTAAMKVPGANAAVIQAASLGFRWAYAEAMQYVWYTSVAFGVISIGCCAMLPNIRKYMTDRIAVDMH